MRKKEFLKNIRNKILEMNEASGGLLGKLPGSKSIFNISESAAGIIVEEDIEAITANKEKLKAEFRKFNFVPTLNSWKRLQKLYAKLEKRLFELMDQFDKQRSTSMAISMVLTNKTGFLGFGGKEHDIDSHLKNPGFVRMLLSDKKFLLYAGAFIALYGINVVMAIFTNTGISPGFSEMFNYYDHTYRNWIVNRIVFWLFGMASYKFGEVYDAYMSKDMENHPWYQGIHKRFGKRSKIFMGLVLAAVFGTLYHGAFKIFRVPGLVSERDWVNILANALGAVTLPLFEKLKNKYKGKG